MNVYIIGVGPGNGRYLIKESEEKIENADIIIGAKRLIKPYCNKKTFAAITPFDIISIIKSNNQCENIAVLMSGDASFYSGTKKLVLELEKEKIKYNILPGISSVSYMSAKTGIPLDEAGFLSLHGRKMSIMGTILSSRYTYILTQSDCGIICQRLQKIGFGGFKVYIGENLSLENEKITCDYAKNLTEYESCGLCVMLVENNEKLIDGIAGIPDENFIRGNVPMTKREIRASIASRMHVSKNECIYDIGAGTGSVSIELALADYMGTVYAIEENEEACALIKENSDKFGTDNIQIVNKKK